MFFISIDNKCGKKTLKLCCMMVWFWEQILTSCLGFHKLNIFMLSYILPVKFFINLTNKFDKIIHQCEKIFFKTIFCIFLSLLFISMHGFSHTSRLNLMALCALFNTNPWFRACFNFLKCLRCFSLSCRLATSFSTFQFSFFQLKMVNHCEFHVICKQIQHQL